MSEKDLAVAESDRVQGRGVRWAKRIVAHLIFISLGAILLAAFAAPMNFLWAMAPELYFGSVLAIVATYGFVGLLWLASHWLEESAQP